MAKLPPGCSNSHSESMTFISCCVNGRFICICQRTAQWQDRLSGLLNRKGVPSAHASTLRQLLGSPSTVPAKQGSLAFLSMSRVYRPNLPHSMCTLVCGPTLQELHELSLVVSLQEDFAATNFGAKKRPSERR